MVMKVEMQKYRKLGDGESLGSSDKWDLKREQGEGLLHNIGDSARHLIGKHPEEPQEFAI